MKVLDLAKRHGSDLSRIPNTDFDIGKYARILRIIQAPLLIYIKYQYEKDRAVLR